MTFLVNDSPLAGTEGDKVTSRVIRDRLFKEAEGNVAIASRGLPGVDGYIVSGRGELQLAHSDRDHAARRLRARRVAPEGGVPEGRERRTLEPIEEVVIDVDEEHSGVVVQKMAERKGEMVEMRPSGGNRLRLVFYAPRAASSAIRANC